MSPVLEIGGHRIDVGHPDKVFFPDAGITKGELVEYYERIANTILPFLRDRPLAMRRYPDGIDGHDFFQKDAPDHFPGWIRRETVGKQGGTVDHVVCDDAATLVYLADQACIESHVFLSKVGALDRPDRMIFDLDPSQEDLSTLRDAARRFRDLLEEIGLVPFVMTSGSRGFHVVVPLRAEDPFDEVRDLAQGIARLLATEDPDHLTVQTRKDQRGGRIFLDYLRNAYAATSIPPYAVRARPSAPVATPLDWEELGDTEPRTYTIRNLFRRLGQKEDPWRGMQRRARTLDGARAELRRRVHSG
ncbi:MAG TPA: non-homologous end-joining DNA ligase [Actinomycetota bacterium]|jgi:bifunctional non-homologous end joining protein LigD|nr:non-homologous end-joining DNA ligase [Actinomycetota bacterium]